MIDTHMQHLQQLKQSIRRLLRPLALALVAVLPAVAPLAAPTVARAADDETPEVVDARLEGYGSNVTINGSGIALTWLLLIVLAGIGLGVLFKDAKRSHLD